MIYRRIGLMVLTAFLLNGCATFHHNTATPTANQDYIQKSQSIAETKAPAGMTVSGVQNYYPIPPVTTEAAANTTAPSLLPPGTPTQQQVAQQQRVASARPAAPAAPAKSSMVVAASTTSLVLNANYDQAWKRVGSALHSSGYKILQQDSSVGTYFVLDTASTGGKLKTTTPIYQVHLTSSGSNTTVSLLDEKNQPANPGVGARILGALKQKL